MAVGHFFEIFWRGGARRLFRLGGAFALLLALGLHFASPAKACISVAVAVVKSEKTETEVAWQISFNKETEEEKTCAKKAVKTLAEIMEYQEEPYDEIRVLMGDKKQGHTLNGGFWAVVSSSRKEDGKRKKSYGLGASEKSLAEAEKRALLNLAAWDKGWDKKKHKYKIEDKGKF